MTEPTGGLDKKLAECLDTRRNVVVHACAGSGKTWLLTSRIILILLDDPELPLSSVLAITYTNNAAAEIRARVVSRLREMKEADEKSLDELLGQIGIKATEKTRARARAMHDRFILARPKLSVRTFHSWFNHIISHLPWEMRLNYNRQILSNAGVLRRKAWHETVKAASSDDRLGEALKGLLGSHRIYSIRSLLDTVLDKRTEWYLHFGVPPEDERMEEVFLARLDENLPRPQGLGVEELVADEGFKALVDEIVVLMQVSSVKGKILQKSLDNLLLVSSSQGDEAFGHARKAVLTAKDELNKNLLKQWDKVVDGSPDANRELLHELAGLLRQALEVRKWLKARKYNELACRLSAAYARFFDRLKQQEGAIEYADMELIPMRMLAGGADGEDSPQAGLEMIERMDTKYRHILIDEFQDTNPVQWRLLREWLRMSQGGDNQPSVFIVGDPKQSIYGFRGGNPRLLAAASEYLGENYGGKEVHINTTRRCAEKVIDVVNAVFKQGGTLDMEGFEPHDTLAAGLPGQVTCLEVPEREEKEDKPAPGTHLRNPLRTEPETSAPVKRAAGEGTRIAQCLAKNLPRLQVAGDDGKARPPKFDEVMLLLPSRSNSQAMLDAISAAGMPCAMAGGTNRAKELECRDIVALLRTIFDPAYGLALAHVLRSPIFSVTEDDLWAVREAGSFREGGGADWVRGLKKAKGSADLERAQELIEKWRGEYRRDKLPAHEALARCYHDADIVERYMRAVPVGFRKRVAQNLEWILNHAIEAGGGRYAQLAEYADFIDSMADSDDSDAAAVSDQQENIQVMSVHGSKGLESPVVVLAYSDYRSRTPGARLLVGWDHEDLGDRPSHVSFLRTNTETVGPQSHALEAMENDELREKLNLLYVAATRAKNLLVVSSRSKSAAWGEAIRSAMVGQLGATEAEGHCQHGDAGESPAGDKGAGVETAKGATEDLLPLEPYSGTLRIGKGGIAQSKSMRRGTLLHHMMAMRLSGVVDHGTQRRLLAVGQREFEEIAAMADRIMDPGTEFGRLLARKDRVEVELPIVARDRSLRIDCLLREGDKGWVLDFKTGSVDEGTHRKQMEGYREVVEGSGMFGTVCVALVDADGSLIEIN